MPNTIKLIIQGGTEIDNILWTSNMNVQQVLEAAYNTFLNPPSIPMLNFWIAYFGPALGYMVTMLDGTAQMGNTYWILYMNAVVAPNGIDRTIVNAGDQIQFKYEVYSPSLHANTMVEKVHEIRKVKHRHMRGFNDRIN
jgi:hypothetical protein